MPVDDQCIPVRSLWQWCNSHKNFQSCTVFLHVHVDVSFSLFVPRSILLPHRIVFAVADMLQFVFVSRDAVSWSAPTLNAVVPVWDTTMSVTNGDFRVTCYQCNSDSNAISVVLPGP